MRSFYITCDLFLQKEKEEKKKKKKKKNRIFLVFITVFSNKKEKRKKQAASKKEAGGDAKHVFFFTSPNAKFDQLTNLLVFKKRLYRRLNTLLANTGNKMKLGYIFISYS